MEFLELTAEQQRRVRVAERQAHSVYRHDNGYVEHYCFICRRATDHRGEHDLSQYLDWYAERHRSGVSGNIRDSDA